MAIKITAWELKRGFDKIIEQGDHEALTRFINMFGTHMRLDDPVLDLDFFHRRRWDSDLFQAVTGELTDIASRHAKEWQRKIPPEVSEPYQRKVDHSMALLREWVVAHKDAFQFQDVPA